MKQRRVEIGAHTTVPDKAPIPAVIPMASSQLVHFDRLVFVGLYRLVPGIVDGLAIVRPETVIRWHRAGFRSFWRWRSRRRGGRPRVPLEPVSGPIVICYTLGGNTVSEVKEELPKLLDVTSTASLSLASLPRLVLFISRSTLLAS
jgi:hypothetical protein